MMRTVLGMRVALAEGGTFTQAPMTLPLEFGNGRDGCHFPEKLQPQRGSQEWPVSSRENEASRLLQTDNPVNLSEAAVPERNTKGGGLYLYGITPDDHARRWNLQGINRAPFIYTISHNGLSAVVSDGAGELLEATQEDLLTHNRVLEQVMQSCSVLPLRLGTVARDAADVHALLHTSQRPLRNALKQIARKVEFDVEAAWNGGEIFKLIEEQDVEVRKCKENAFAAGKPLKPDEQMAAGILVANAIARQRAQFAKSVEEELKPCSERVNSLKSRSTEIVFNAAFLVHEERAKAFEAAIYRLGDLHGRILKFRYAGPLPCYSFVNLHVVNVEFQAVDEARRTLGLGEQTTLSRIKQAFRKLAPQSHPDRNSTDPEATSRFEKLAASYKLLLGLWENTGGDSSQPISLTRESVGKTMLVISREPRLASPSGELSKSGGQPIEVSMRQSW
jgi:hypothetical protein